MLFDQDLPLLSEVRSSNGAELPRELDVGIGSDQMELTNGGFHHGQLHAVESFVLELGEEGRKRSEPVVGDESLIVNRCQRLATELRRN